MTNNLVWINCCEASADNYGAGLMDKLRHLSPGTAFMGMGGPAMRKAGLDAVFRSEDLSLVGLTEVFGALPRIGGYLFKIRQLLREKRPDILILLDAPDFNFFLARMARSLNIPVLYYIAPQAWAWRKSRVSFLKGFTDGVACIFPFEQKFFLQHGVNASFVGHPFMEQLDLQAFEEVLPEQNQIAILPGSRKKEISTLLPVFIMVAEQLRSTSPGLEFNVVQAPGISMDYIAGFCPDKPWVRLVSSENRHSCISRSYFALAASGTVTLECAVLDVPAIVAYRLSRISYLAGRMLIHVRHISMPNLILNEEVYPEFIQDKARFEDIYSKARQWVDEPGETSKIRSRLKTIRTLLGKKSASRNCAALALNIIKKRKIHGQN